MTIFHCIKVYLNKFSIYSQTLLFYLQYKIDCRVTIELLDSENDDPANSVQNVQTWGNYCERLANPASTTTISSAGNGSVLPTDIKTENIDDESVSQKV